MDRIMMELDGRRRVLKEHSEFRNQLHCEWWIGDRNVCGYEDQRVELELDSLVA